MCLFVRHEPHFISTLLSHSHPPQFASEAFPRRRVGTLFMQCHFPELKNNSRLCLTTDGRRLCSSHSNDSTPELSDAYSHEGSSESAENKKGKSMTSNEILKKLRRYGISGILSYGLLNTAYYLTTFLFVWFYIAPAPAKMGYAAAVQRFLKVMAMVWAGSQVTKLLRAGGALALAPFVDRGLSWFTDKFKFGSQGKAFMAIVGFCLALALIVFLVITLLWA
ncbi:hypothetical protein PHAVU_005G013300 [Phaseolus vulgaris]|uniref:Gag-Pol polyprotein/retrotransposon n=1 Tax=Phaseolus vulgaris TaxID=3885 RepID=V7BW23_PHAVU|nr:hypothetical protein PHAVU_005G013300g [Phaseolus vulgaris]ESW20771.1 hypothetical protein PHAVU_005G013300g [Phaseolus vulgaris]